jgi:hypothetical protein
MLYDKKWDKAAETKPLAEWQQDLLNGAQHIREHGWCQGMEYAKRGRAACLVGAIYRNGEIPIRRLDVARKCVANFLGLNGDPAMAVVLWNDAGGRTKEEVITALEGAAKLEV